jgi:hypothetical protein
LSDFAREESNTKSKSKSSDFFEAAAKFSSRINVSSLSFQEESRHIQKEYDQKYHYYGLYSISTGKPGTAAEYECFTYHLKYSKDAAETFDKQISFNGSRFTRNRPYTARQTANTSPSNPPWLNDPPPEDVIWGIGTERNASAELRNLRAAVRAVTAINSQVQEMIQDYALGSDVNLNLVKKNRQVSQIRTPKVIKIQDTLTSDGTAWQGWQLSKAEAKKVITEAMGR